MLGTPAAKTPFLDESHVTTNRHYAADGSQAGTGHLDDALARLSAIYARIAQDANQLDTLADALFGSQPETGNEKAIATSHGKCHELIAQTERIAEALSFLEAQLARFNRL